MLHVRWLFVLCCAVRLKYIPIKDDTVAENWAKNKKRQIPATFFAKYTCVEMASGKIEAYQN